MSSIVKTVTPFIDIELLTKALNAVGCSFTIRGNEILTDRTDHYGNQKFVFLGGRYQFEHEERGHSWASQTVNEFIWAVGNAYDRLYRQQVEELEKKRLAAIAEAERLRKEYLAEQERLRQLALAEEERKKAEEERIRKEQLARQEEQRLLGIAKKAEEEKQRLERERKEFVEKQKTAIITKAKEQGYDVQEKVVDRKVKLVLVKTTY